MAVADAFSLSHINVRDTWFDHYVKLVREAVIPYQYLALHDEIPDAAPSHSVNNFRLAAAKLRGEPYEGTFRGFVFQDSDVAKWIEAAAYSLASRPDPDLKRQVDELIDLVVSAQCDDGYLNSYFTLEAEDKRWKNLADCHELYVAGHLIEAAVAYHDATGEEKLLTAVCRFADLICEVFGPGEEQIPGYPGHEEIELALVRLYRKTGTKRYLDMAEFFILERGQAPNYFAEERRREDFFAYYGGSANQPPILDYHQAHKPVMEQEHAAGHAVRAVYLYIGMAEVAAETGNEALLDRTIRLWEDITRHQMYVTGGIGQSGTLERFTRPDDLPNDANYSETCASIALALLSLRLGQITGEARFHDIAELELYNGIASGISLDGTRFFYVNPMEVWPDNCLPHTSRSHVKPERQSWFPCACCPPNLARTYAGLGRYLLSADETADTPVLYVQQYVGQESRFKIRDEEVSFALTGDYALEGKVRIRVSIAAPLTVKLRQPGWADGWQVDHNEAANRTESVGTDGYLAIALEAGDHVINVDFRPAAVYLKTRPEVRENYGKVALRRGPLIFAAESIDNGENLAGLLANVTHEPVPTPLDGTVPGLRGEGFREIYPEWPEASLYRSVNEVQQSLEPVTITYVPYALWGNRDQKPGEMRVWIRQASAQV